MLGVNDRTQLAAAEAILQARLRAKAMRDGATLIDPSSVTLSFDTRAWPRCRRRAACCLRSRRQRRRRQPDPFVFVSWRARRSARMQRSVPSPGCVPVPQLAHDVHIGNFVEVKASEVGAGAKINHLSYIGDASIGAKTNIGAGTITCNYDGFAKYSHGDRRACVHRLATVPWWRRCKIGDGAYVGSGSVITQDVAPDALALGPRAPDRKARLGQGFPGQEPEMSAALHGRTLPWQHGPMAVA